MSHIAARKVSKIVYIRIRTVGSRGEITCTRCGDPLLLRGGEGGCCLERRIYVYGALEAVPNSALLAYVARCSGTGHPPLEGEREGVGCPFPKSSAGFDIVLFV